MNNLTLKVATLVAVLYTSWAHANQLPQTAEYGITYDSEGTAGEGALCRALRHGNRRGRTRLRLHRRRVPAGAVEGRRDVLDYLPDRHFGPSWDFYPQHRLQRGGSSRQMAVAVGRTGRAYTAGKLHIGLIQGDDLSSIIRRIPLTQIDGQPRHISQVQVAGKGIEAAVVDGGTAIEITPAAGLTWGERLVATIEATIAAEGEEHPRSIEVRGRVSPRFSLEPQSASFGIGVAQRRETRQVRLGLPAELADAPVQASPVCGEVELDIEHQREADNSLVVQIRNAGDFPAGTLTVG